MGRAGGVIAPRAGCLHAWMHYRVVMSTITSKRQVTIPKDAMDAMHWPPGTQVRIVPDGNTLRIEPVTDSLQGYLRRPSYFGPGPFIMATDDERSAYFDAKHNPDKHT